MFAPETNSCGLKSILIIPCFNRKAVTLSCLRHLRALELPARFRLMLVDDGSSDGTAEAVAGEFPEVEVVNGSGDLYWTGAVETGMRLAFARGASSVVWLNDDTVVAAGAIEAVVKRAEELGGLVSGQGQIVDPTDGKISYFPLYYRGKSNLRTEPVDLGQEEIAVDSCRGNLVAVSRQVVEAIGYPDGAKMPHMAGDTDYGLRASRAGLPVRVLTGARVNEICAIPYLDQSWLYGHTPLTKLWRRVLQKRNGLYPPTVFVYHWRHWGIHGLGFALVCYAKLVAISGLRIFPRCLRVLLFGRFSNSLS